MKINKRLSEEFGAPLPSPSIAWDWWVDKLFGSIIPITVGSSMLSVGAILQIYFHFAVWCFLTIAGLGILLFLAGFIAVCAANMLDEPMQW